MSAFTHGAASPADTSISQGKAENWPKLTEFAGGISSANQASLGVTEDAVDIRLAMLARAIEHEIIPRLMLAHRETHECVAALPQPAQVVTAKEVQDFANLVLATDTDQAQTAIDAMLLRGITVETIYLNLLAPVARLMGEMWEQDLCDFTEVTIGLGRLHQVLRSLSSAFDQPQTRSVNGLRILLLPSPGEQHTFGLVMVSEFFCHAGWDVAGGAWQADADAASLVKNEWFDVLGFSVGAEIQLESLRLAIESARKSSLNPNLVIMVGGPIFVLHPQFVAQVGADSVSTDGKQAPILAQAMVTNKKQVAQQ